MKKIVVILLMIIFVATLSFVGCKTEVAPVEELVGEEPVEEETVEEETEPAEEPSGEVEEATELFTLDDIPEIENKTSICTVAQTGGIWDAMLPYIDIFTQKTGIMVEVERIASPVVYSKENIEFVAGTGIYDVAYVETSWTSEWSQYLYDLRELASQFEPGGVEALDRELQNFSQLLLNCGKAYGKQIVIPQYTYHMAMYIRQDVFDDPTEQADFEAKYNYDLKPATNYNELYDQAEFFSRKEGETLKGETLDHDINGVAMMAGAYQNNDEFSSYLWGKGSDYAILIRDDDGNPKEFVITQEAKDVMKETLEEYISLTEFTSPGCSTANFDFVTTEQGAGRAIIQPTQFTGGIFEWAADLVNDNVPGGKLGIYPTIGERPYTGAWSLGVVKASDNPEAAYWLIRYLNSYEIQRDLMKVAGQTATRMDVMSSPEWQTAENIYPYGVEVDYLLSNWSDEEYIKFISDRYYFNSAAAGKVYEMQMNILAKGIHGELSVDECINELTGQTVTLCTKFDIIPIREE